MQLSFLLAVLESSAVSPGSFPTFQRSAPAVFGFFTHFGWGYLLWGFPGSSAGKESACNAGDPGSIPGLGRSPGGGHGHPLQYSCVENLQGQRSLAVCSPWGHKELDTIEQLNTAQLLWAYQKNCDPDKCAGWEGGMDGSGK